MTHLNYEFDAGVGDVAEVIIDRAANVLLMDQDNYDNYKLGRVFEYHDGGYSEKSPVRLEVPTRGHWQVVIDLGGGPGQVRASLSILSGNSA